LRGWLKLALLLSVSGCVESQLDELPPIQQNATFSPPIDDFWLHQEIEERTRPPLVRAQSISLGYVGDTPLSGGVMRDTPMPPYQQQAPYDYAGPIQ
jgi:hypothetical protein